MKLGRATSVARRSRESNSDRGIAPPAPRHDQPFGPPNVDHRAEEDRQSLPSEQTSGVEDEPRFFGGIRGVARRAQFIERESIWNQRRGPEPRIVGAHHFVTDRIRNEEDVTDAVPIVQFDWEQGRKHGQRRPLRVVQGAAVPDRPLDPASLAENRRVRRDDGRAGRRIGPQVGHLGVVDDEKVRPVFADEIRPSSLERPLEPVIVRHDAAPVREGHRAVAGVRRGGLAAEDRHLVSRCEAREELPEVRPDPAPDSPEFRGRHGDLRFLVPPVLGCVNQCSAQDLASLTSRNPNPPAPRASMRRAALLRWKIFSAPLFES